MVSMTGPTSKTGTSRRELGECAGQWSRPAPRRCGGTTSQGTASTDHGAPCATAAANDDAHRARPDPEEHFPKSTAITCSSEIDAVIESTDRHWSRNTAGRAFSVRTRCLAKASAAAGWCNNFCEMCVNGGFGVR